jgi:vancomycin resistance protein VanJ
MQRTLGNVCVGVVWVYAALTLLWFGLHARLGDAFWWLTLLNIAAPYLFLPLALLLPACLLCRRWDFWLGTFVPLLLFLLLYGKLFLPGGAAAASDTDERLTVMTFNIWGFSRSAETARALLQDGTPDIVVLQELSHEMSQVLEEELGDVYPYRLLNTEPANRHSGVLSRYPVTELEPERYADPGWRIQVYRVEVGERAFVLYNVHLRVVNFWTLSDGLGAFAEEIQAGARYRAEQARWILEDMAHRPEPVIIAGDFNTTDQSDAYRLLAAQLTDAYRAAGWGLGHSFPAYSGRLTGIPIPRRLVRIDMILVSDAFVPLRSRAGAVYGESDHLPMWAELAWPVGR